MNKSPYMNSDGTFKGGFDGCVLHMQNIESHSLESAKAICGKIAQETLHNRAGQAVLSGDFKHPADGWYQIETPGEHPNREAGVVQVIDQVAVTGMVNRFNQEADSYEAANGPYQIGRASCRERGGIWGGGGQLREEMIRGGISD